MATEDETTTASGGAPTGVPAPDAAPRYTMPRVGTAFTAAERKDGATIRRDRDGSVMGYLFKNGNTGFDTNVVLDGQGKFLIDGKVVTSQVAMQAVQKAIMVSAAMPATSVAFTEVEKKNGHALRRDEATDKVVGYRFENNQVVSVVATDTKVNLRGEYQVGGRPVQENAALDAINKGFQNALYIPAQNTAFTQEEKTRGTAIRRNTADGAIVGHIIKGGVSASTFTTGTILDNTGSITVDGKPADQQFALRAITRSEELAITKDNLVPEGGNQKYYAMWNQPHLRGTFDPSLFRKGITEDEMMRDPKIRESLTRAADLATLGYSMFSEPDISVFNEETGQMERRPAPAPDPNQEWRGLSPEARARDGLQHARENNYNLPSMLGNIYYQRFSNATEEQKLAMVYLHQTFEHYTSKPGDWAKSGAFVALGLPIGGGIRTAGTAALAKLGLKETVENLAGKYGTAAVMEKLFERYAARTAVTTLFEAATTRIGQAGASRTLTQLTTAGAGQVAERAAGRIALDTASGISLRSTATALANGAVLNAPSTLGNTARIQLERTQTYNVNGVPTQFQNGINYFDAAVDTTVGLGVGSIFGGTLHVAPSAITGAFRSRTASAIFHAPGTLMDGIASRVAASNTPTTLFGGLQPAYAFAGAAEGIGDVTSSRRPFRSWFARGKVDADGTLGLHPELGAGGSRGVATDVAGNAVIPAVPLSTVARDADYVRALQEFADFNGQPRAAHLTQNLGIDAARARVLVEQMEADGVLIRDAATGTLSTSAAAARSRLAQLATQAASAVAPITSAADFRASLISNQARDLAVMFGDGSDEAIARQMAHAEQRVDAFTNYGITPGNILEKANGSTKQIDQIRALQELVKDAVRITEAVDAEAVLLASRLGKPVDDEITQHAQFRIQAREAHGITAEAISARAKGSNALVDQNTALNDLIDEAELAQIASASAPSTSAVAAAASVSPTATPVAATSRRSGSGGPTSGRTTGGPTAGGPTAGAGGPGGTAGGAGGGGPGGRGPGGTGGGGTGGPGGTAAGGGPGGAALTLEDYERYLRVRRHEKDIDKEARTLARTLGDESDANVDRLKPHAVDRVFARLDDEIKAEEITKKAETIQAEARKYRRPVPTDEDAQRLALTALQREMRDVIVTPYQSVLHKAVRFDPFTQMNRRWAIIGGRFGGESGTMATVPAHWHIPSRDLFSHKFLNPMIDHVDDQVRAAGLIQPIKELRERLDTLRLEFQANSARPVRDRIQRDIDNTVKKFAEDNKDKFADLRARLVPFKDRMDAGIARGGAGTGRAGLDTEEIGAVKRWLDHINRLSDDVQDPDDFVSKYNSNRGLYGTVNGTGPRTQTETEQASSITGAFQHYFLLGAEADMRIKGRDYTGWSPTVTNSLRSELKIRDSLINKAELADMNIIAADLSAGKITQAEHDELVRVLNEKYEYLRSPVYQSAIDNGDDGFFASGASTNNHLNLYAENIVRKQRDLKDAYMNTEIRTKPVVLVGGGDQPENVENYAIVLGTLFDKYRTVKDAKIDNKKLADDILALADQAYASGREGDFANAYRRLGMQMGRDGTKRPIPGEIRALITERLIPVDKAHDAHYKYFMNYLSEGSKIRHSPEFYGQRHWEQIVEGWTRGLYGGRLAPMTDVMGTPGRQDFIKEPRARLMTEITAALFGGKVVTVEGLDEYGRPQVNYSYKGLYWDKAPEGSSFPGKVWHYATESNPISKFAFTSVTLPLRMVAGTFNNVVVPVYHHTWRMGATMFLAGAITAGAQEVGEYAFNGGENLPVNPGVAAMKASVNFADIMYGTPLRVAAYASEPLFNAGLRTQQAMFRLPFVVTGHAGDKNATVLENFYPEVTVPFIGTKVESHFIRNRVFNTYLPGFWRDWSEAAGNGIGFGPAGDPSIESPITAPAEDTEPEAGAVTGAGGTETKTEKKRGDKAPADEQAPPPAATSETPSTAPVEKETTPAETPRRKRGDRPPEDGQGASLVIPALPGTTIGGDVLSRGLSGAFGNVNAPSVEPILTANADISLQLRLVEVQFDQNRSSGLGAVPGEQASNVNVNRDKAYTPNT